MLASHSFLPIGSAILGLSLFLPDSLFILYFMAIWLWFTRLLLFHHYTGCILLSIYSAVYYNTLIMHPFTLDSSRQSLLAQHYVLPCNLATRYLCVVVASVYAPRRRTASLPQLLAQTTVPALASCLSHFPALNPCKYIGWAHLPFPVNQLPLD